MKRFLKGMLLSLILMFPLMVSAKDNVAITSVKLQSKTDTAEVGEATFNGLTVNFNVSFSQKDDNVVYLVNIKNNDNKDYEIDKGVLANTSKNIKYTLDYTGSGIIKANSSKQVKITIDYYNLVDDNQFVNGRFVDDNKMTINLRNNENPKTSSTVIVLLAVLALLLGTMVFLKVTPKAKLTMLIALSLLPIATVAATRITITINSKVEIVQFKDFCIIDQATNAVTNYKYIPGMTLKEYCNSKYANISNVCSKTENRNSLEQSTLNYSFFANELVTCLTTSSQDEDLPSVKSTEPKKGAAINSCYSQYSNKISEVDINNEKIKDKSLGCYEITINDEGKK